MPSAPTGPAIYFSDCGAGASAGCVVGDNANPGTSLAAPKRNLSGFDVNAQPANTHVLFARGGVWENFNLAMLRNLNATPSAPLVFDSYTPSWGGSTAPALKTSSGDAISFGPYNDTVADGGYTFRNLKLDGGGTAKWGFILVGETRNVLVEHMEITGFEIAVHFQNMGATGNTAMVIRSNDIHHNREMGMLGDANDMVIEGNRIANNNFSGSGFNHGVYLGGHAHNGIVRNNLFANNSVVNGVCTGGNLTVHGQWDGLLIEGNTVTQNTSEGGCYAMSITPGYVSAEFFRNFVVRGNTVVNTGGCGICLGASAAPLVENNLLINLNDSWMSGVVLAANVGSPGAGGDDVDNGAIVRNNTMCFVHPRPESQQVATANAGQVTVSGTVYRTGADATTGPCAR